MKTTPSVVQRDGTQVLGMMEGEGGGGGRGVEAESLSWGHHWRCCMTHKD